MLWVNISPFTKKQKWSDSVLTKHIPTRPAEVKRLLWLAVALWGVPPKRPFVQTKRKRTKRKRWRKKKKEKRKKRTKKERKKKQREEKTD